jgi:acetoacetate decarboxylase
MKEQEEGFSMPLGAPAFGAPPFKAMPEGRVVFVFFEADRGAIEFEVPAPLEPTGDNLCLAWIGDMRQPTHTMDLYHECLTAIKTRYEGYVGWYINYIWVSHDMALTFSRELYGWPASLCEDTPLRFVGSQIFGSCRRYGEELMRMSVNITSPPSPDGSGQGEVEFGRLVAGEWLQIRKIPSPEKDGKPLKQLFRIPTTNFKLHEIWSGNAVLELGQSGYYPHLHRLAPTKVHGAFLVRAEWIVPHAELLWQADR